MKTGMATIDNAIAKFGLTHQPIENEFQSVVQCFGGETPALRSVNLPFCINQFLFNAPLYSQWLLHQFELPKTNKKLACFITDLNGNVVERVYYQNSRKYYDACDKLVNRVSSLFHATEQAA